MSLILSGCEVDYYQEPEDNQGSGSSLFGDSITVPAGFDWATMLAVNVNVKVDDQYNGNYYYMVELFDSNPVFDENASLLGSGVAKLNNDFSAAVVLPTALERIYVQQTDPTGKQAVKVIQISGQTSAVNFGGISSSASFRSAMQVSTSTITNNTRATTSGYDAPTREYPTPASAIDITNGTFSGTLSPGQSYKIPAGKTYNGNINFAWGDGADLYIEGTWNTTSGVELRNSRLIIQDGGEFNPGGNVSVNNSRIVVASAGKFNKENKAIDIQNNTFLQIINNGLLKVREISKIQGLYNYGEMDVAGDLSSNATNIVFVNENTLTVGGKITLKGYNKLLNYDTLNITGDLVSDSEHTEILNEKTLIVGGKVTLNSSNKLYNYDTMNVTGDLTSVSTNTEILNEKTLMVGGKITLNGSNKLYNYDTMNITGDLEVNTNNVTIDSKRLTVGTIKMNGSGNILTNSCQIIANEVTLTSGISVNIKTGSLFISDVVNIAGSSINLESHGILEVNQELKFTNNGSSINGPSSGNKALARLKKVTVGNYARPSYGGYLEVECADHSPNINPTPYTEGANVTFVRDGSNSSLVIPATECNDGGNNNTDPGTPTNPTFPIIYEGSALTYMFEDGWPYLGDYDMNDLVLDVTPSYSTNADNKVTQLQLNVTLRAAGATKRLAVGLQLDGINPGMIRSIARSNNEGINGNVFNQSNGLESGQTYAVIPVFDDVHVALGHSSSLIINTVKGSGNNVIPRQVTFTIDFNNPLDLASISVYKFNVFIINGGYKGKRQEIHLAGFQPTGKADRSKFGSADDNSNIKPYTSKNNMIWGLVIPGPAKYPVEWTSIRLAYPGLESWATSGGTSGKDWYKNSNENRVYDR